LPLLHRDWPPTSCSGDQSGSLHAQQRRLPCGAATLSLRGRVEHGPRDRATGLPVEAPARHQALAGGRAASACRATIGRRSAPRPGFRCMHSSVASRGAPHLVFPWPSEARPPRYRAGCWRRIRGRGERRYKQRASGPRTHRVYSDPPQAGTPDPVLATLSPRNLCSPGQLGPQSPPRTPVVQLRPFRAPPRAAPSGTGPRCPCQV